MKNILLSLFIVMSFMAFTGCSSMDSGIKSTKCGGGKCGADKKVEEVSKCGSDESSKKCGGAK